jgi:thiol-disulfide isomerase/thioredoxin
VFIGVIAIGMALAWAFGGDGEVARVGARAPDFTVSLVDGGRFTLSDHIADDGRPLVINLWASWCAPCREEIPFLSAFAEANPDVAVVGVAVEDTADDSIRLAAELRPSYPLAHGDTQFEESYPNFGLPMTYFLDSDGVVIEVFNGILTEAALTEMTG